MANWKKKLRKAGKKIGVGLTHEEKIESFKKQKEELKLRTEVAKQRAALSKYKGKGSVFGVRLRTPEEQARMPSMASVFGYEKPKVAARPKAKKRRKPKRKRSPKKPGRTFTISY